MKCEPTSHKQHMCALTADNDTKTISALSNKPTVECGNCGAKANSPENVCNPVKLPAKS